MAQSTPLTIRADLDPALNRAAALKLAVDLHARHVLCDDLAGMSKRNDFVLATAGCFLDWLADEPADAAKRYDEARDARAERQYDRLATSDLLEAAWGVIANATTTDAPSEWIEAAYRWRDRYHAWLDANTIETASQEDAPPLASLVDAAPDAAGGLITAEHLDLMRGDQGHEVVLDRDGDRWYIHHCGQVDCKRSAPPDDCLTCGCPGEWRPLYVRAPTGAESAPASDTPAETRQAAHGAPGADSGAIPADGGPRSLGLMEQIERAITDPSSRVRRGRPRRSDSLIPAETLQAAGGKSGAESGAFPADAITAAAEAIEDAAMRLIGRDLGTIHRDTIAQAGLAAAWPILAAEWANAGPTAAVNEGWTLTTDPGLDGLWWIDRATPRTSYWLGNTQPDIDPQPDHVPTENLPALIADLRRALAWAETQREVTNG